MDCGPASGASVDGQGVVDSVYGYAVSQAGLFPVNDITGNHRVLIELGSDSLRGKIQLQLLGQSYLLFHTLLA